MDELSNLLELMNAFARLGSMVTQQLIDVVQHGESLDEQNPNALRTIDRELLYYIEYGPSIDWNDLEEEVGELRAKIAERVA